MKTKSIWGCPPTRLYKLINLAEKEFGKNFTACVVGCSDGKFLLPFARKSIKVIGYDIDDVALYGGIKSFPVVDNKVKINYSTAFVSEKYPLVDKAVMGINDRIKKENTQKYCEIQKRDFYKNVPNRKFEVVFTSCSLHYSVNKDFSLEEKTRKLQEVVEKKGYLYIDYMMAIDEDDNDKFPPNKFYRKNEILNYFNDKWEIISFRENHKPTFEGAHVDCVVDHFHRFGYVLARKVK